MLLPLSSLELSLLCSNNIVNNDTFSFTFTFTFSSILTLLSKVRGLHINGGWLLQHIDLIILIIIIYNSYVILAARFVLGVSGPPLGLLLSLEELALSTLSASFDDTFCPFYNKKS